MVKRKIEDDEEQDWGAAPKKAYRAPRKSAVATQRVKNEPLDNQDIHSIGAAVIAGTSSSAALIAPPHDGEPVPAVPHKPSKRVKKEVDAGEKRLARLRKSCPKVSKLILPRLA